MVPCGGAEDGRDEALLDGRVEVGVSVGDGADRAFDLFCACVFGEVAVRAGLQGWKERVVVGVGGEHEDMRFWQGRANRACRLGAFHLGHAEVHEDDVGAQLAGEGDGFDAVRGRAHDLDVVGEPDEHCESLADGPLVVGDEDADHAGTSSSTRQPVSVGPACMRPPARSSRSRIPFRPFPPPTPARPAALAGGVARRSSTVSEVRPMP